MNICVVGGGLSGLVAGYKLSKKGHKVTIIEKESKVGGLARSFSEGNDSIPIVYHHIMRSDKITRNLIKELGLWDKFFQKKTKMGFYSDGKIHKLSGPLDVFKFKPLSFSSRIKFLLFGLKVKLWRDWDGLENVSAKEWITKSANKEIYEKVFEPLLKIKFSDDSDNIVARWVGERLNMGESSGPFGYMEGGLEQLLNAMEARIVESGGAVKLNCIFTKFKMSAKGERVEGVVFSEGGKKKTVGADYVIYTGPVPLLSKAAKFPASFDKKLKGIKYKSTICAAIGLDRQISDYYWVNFIAGGFSFGGIIDHTKLNPHLQSAKSMLYVFIYLNKDDALWKESDKNILDKYVKELDMLFGIQDSIKWKRLFRVEYSKPVYDLDYREHLLGYSTPIENLYLGGIASFYPNIRNMGTAIKTGIRLSEIVMSKSGSQANS